MFVIVKHVEKLIRGGNYAITLMIRACAASFLILFFSLRKQMYQRSPLRDGRYPVAEGCCHVGHPASSLQSPSPWTHEHKPSSPTELHRCHLLVRHHALHGSQSSPVYICLNRPTGCPNIACFFVFFKMSENNVYPNRSIVLHYCKYKVYFIVETYSSNV